MGYSEFLDNKTHLVNYGGFDPIWMPDKLFDFQKSLVDWSLRKGRSAIFADCGLGKTFIQLVWAENVRRKTGGKVLVLTPLSVAFQTVKEAQKLGLEIEHRKTGIKENDGIIVANYERLHYFNPRDFSGVVCDESSILKNFDGATKEDITNFMLKIQYRLLCTATAAPNDYIELGTSSEALGELGYIDMLKMFFKSDGNSYAQGGSGNGANRFNKNPFGSKFRFRGHSERSFWRWVCSWARSLRKPSDLGFSDEKFKLPELICREHVVEARTKADGFLFELPANGLKEQKEEQRRTIKERCEMVAQLICSHNNPAVAWCHLNEEGRLIERLIPGAVEICGSDSDDKKESAFRDFSEGSIRVIVTKPTIAGFGLNWQHCAHQTFFPSHSYEQYYQSLRRCWRFGQKNNVIVDLVTTTGQSGVLKNLKRKTEAAEQMFQNLVDLMCDELTIKRVDKFNIKEELPQWL